VNGLLLQLQVLFVIGFHDDQLQRVLKHVLGDRLHGLVCGPNTAVGCKVPAVVARVGPARVNADTCVPMEQFVPMAMKGFHADDPKPAERPIDRIHWDFLAGLGVLTHLSRMLVGNFGV